MLNEGEADEATKWSDIETFGELSEEEMNELLDDDKIERYAASHSDMKDTKLSKKLRALRFNEDEDMEDLDEGQLFEDEEEDGPSSEKKMSEEDLKIESLKIATNIAKLMSNVTTDDIIFVADKVSNFIRNHEIGEEVEDNSKKEDNEDTEDNNEDEEIENLFGNESSEENTEENTEENKE